MIGYVFICTSNLCCSIFLKDSFLIVVKQRTRTGFYILRDVLSALGMNNEEKQYFKDLLDVSNLNATNIDTYPIHKYDAYNES